jgi:hypothetical protein
MQADTLDVDVCLGRRCRRDKEAASGVVLIRLESVEDGSG